MRHGIEKNILSAITLLACVCCMKDALADICAGQKEQILIGWASRDVTPDGKVNLSGQFYPRVTSKVKDPLSVNVLTISTSKDSLIFVSCDVSSVYVPLINEAKTAIKSKNPEIPVDKIIIHATHTHTAPDIRGVLNYDTLAPELKEGLRLPADNQKLLINGIVGAVLESWEKRQPGQIAWGFGCAVVGNNRRIVYQNDFPEEHQGDPGKVIEKNARLYGQINVPDFSHIEGYEDHNVNFLFTFDMNRKLTGAVINIACPSQESEHLLMISADFWHEVRVALRQKYSNDLFILPQCAAAGDQISRTMRNHRAEERMRELKRADARQIIAGKIGAAFDDALSWASKDIRNEAILAHSVREIKLSRRMPTEEEYQKNLEWAGEYEAKENPTPSQRSYLRRCRAVVQRYEQMKQGLELFQPMEMHIIRLGDIAFATNSFELFLDYGIRIQAQSPAIQTFIVQLAGKGNYPSGSYLPTLRAENGGGYGANVYCNKIGSKGGNELVKESVEELTRVWEQSRVIYNVPRSDGKHVLTVKLSGNNNDIPNHGQASIHWDEQCLHLNVEVSDPTHFNNRTGSNIWDGDALQFAIMPDGDKEFFNIVIAMTHEGVKSCQYGNKKKELEHQKYSVTRDDAQQLTTYRVTLPLESFGIPPSPGSGFCFYILVHNNDHKVCRRIEMNPGSSGSWLDSRLFPKLILSDKRK